MNKKVQANPEEIKQEEPKIMHAQTSTADSEEVDYKDRYLRLLADIENIRKNSAKQISNAYTMANEKLLKEMLPYIDSLNSAIENASITKGQEAVEKGLNYLKKQLMDILAKFGFQEIEIKAGDKFNVDIMDAMMVIPEQTPKDHDNVCAIFEKGYTLNSEVIRHAKVSVYSTQN